MRVLLTRDNDDNVPIDRRTSFANNNKADLFLSLHANSSARPAVRGAQVYTLDLSSYPQQTGIVEARRRTVPVLGGGTRVLDPMPWDLAQLPFAGEAATLAGILVQQFGRAQRAAARQTGGDGAHAGAGRGQHARGPHRAGLPVECRR